jgi:hypothetical protein
LAIVTSAREASKAALRQLRKEISVARRQVEKLVGEERSFRLELFSTGGSDTPRGARKSRKPGRRAGRKAAARRLKPRRREPPKADKYFAQLPAKFTIEDVRKHAGKAAGISVAQWVRAKRVRKTASGYHKVA